MIADVDHGWNAGACAGRDEHLRLLLRENSGMLQILARRYACAFAVEEADLFQEGSIELVKAYDDFEPARGFQFSTYACRRAAKKMIGWAKNKGRLISLKSRSADDWRDRMISVTSIETPVKYSVMRQGGRQGEVAITLGSILPDPTAAPDAVIAAADSSLIREAVMMLSSLHRTILIGRYWQGRTLADIGAQLGCIRQNVERHEKLALKALRHAILRINRQTERAA